jgi:thiamine transport system substrate-binding protein
MLQPQKPLIPVKWLLTGTVLFAVLAVVLNRYESSGVGGEPDRAVVRVLSYKAFLESWGPGPEIAAKFKATTGLTVEFVDSGDAGLLLKKLDLFPADLVIGMDQMTIIEAKRARAWREPAADVTAGDRWRDGAFVAYDWAPLTFVYRQGEIEPPRALEDLLDPRFKGKIAIQDPRTSTPGMQFFFWVLSELGVEPGFEFLKSLKANLHSVSPSWSTAYGLFTKKQASLAFSYLTSPIYHWRNDKDPSYQPAIFTAGHPVQVEYAAIPASCVNCEGAERLLKFLLEAEAQMQVRDSNYMFPVNAQLVDGEFAKLPQVDVFPTDRFRDLLDRKDELLNRWQELKL